MIFEFGAFGRRSFAELRRVPGAAGSVPGATAAGVPLRGGDPQSRVPGARLFRVPARHNVAHVYNAWSKMPELRSQIAIPDSATADFRVCRALLRHGRVYEEAVKTFAPYREVQDPNPEARDSMRVLIGRARENKQFLFLFVNNRLEGNAPTTILSLVEP